MTDKRLAGRRRRAKIYMWARETGSFGVEDVVVKFRLHYRTALRDIAALERALPIVRTAEARNKARWKVQE